MDLVLSYKLSYSIYERQGGREREGKPGGGTRPPIPKGAARQRIFRVHLRQGIRNQRAMPDATRAGDRNRQRIEGQTRQNLADRIGLHGSSNDALPAKGLDRSQYLIGSSGFRHRRKSVGYRYITDRKRWLECLADQYRASQTNGCCDQAITYHSGST